MVTVLYLEVSRLMSGLTIRSIRSPFFPSMTMLKSTPSSVPSVRHYLFAGEVLSKYLRHVFTLYSKLFIYLSVSYIRACFFFRHPALEKLMYLLIVAHKILRKRGLTLFSASLKCFISIFSTLKFLSECQHHSFPADCFYVRAYVSFGNPQVHQ